MYSVEKNVQLLITLMKAHGIKRVIASPGSTNVCLVASIQNDPYFTVYSSIDERSAAYMACGLAAETGEPVALTCTEATASRNYISGLTEAYYRKLPILAITSTNDRFRIGQNHPQMIDRSIVSADVAKKSVYLPILRTSKDEKGYAVLINDAILELTRNGNGPVHIEYETEYSKEYTVSTLPQVDVIRRVEVNDPLPKLSGNIVVFSGAHERWSNELTKYVDAFCEKYGAVILTDHIGNYHGKYGVPFTLVTSQRQKKYSCCNIDTFIYIGNVSSAYKKKWNIRHSWRVNPDGKVRNAFGNLEYVFQMEEEKFFRRYVEENARTQCDDSYRKEWINTYQDLQTKIPELPFSNLWVAQHTLPLLSEGAPLFLGIENTLRSWNFFKTDKHFDGFCNTGGFGIDGGVSSLIGASLANPQKIYFGVTGDLAFFYDMNVLGNRHVGTNIRLMVINNAIGQQFKNPGHPAYGLGDEANRYVAAQGHYGNKSHSLLKHYTEALGFEYLSASSKEEFDKAVDRFVKSEKDKSVLFEIFVDTENETLALDTMQTLDKDVSATAKNATKNAIKKVLGKKGVKIVKGIIGN